MERHIYKIQMKGVHFNVKFMRRGLAFMLAVLLILPTLPASAEEPASSKPEVTEESQTDTDEKSAPLNTDSSGTESKPAEEGKEEPADAEKKDENKQEELPKATPSNVSPDEEAPDKTGLEGEVRFNTGNHEWSIVDKEAFDKGAGDGYFEDDGSYTINIPEENPFFPYEVQFTYQDKVTNEWFMTPDDSVQIGDRTFYVSASFDDTAVTQMSLDVAGDTVVVYPEAKEFTNDGDGTMPASLLPLTERYLTADLSGYTPVELSMVSLDSVFTGSNQLKDTDKVAWTYGSRDNYTISTKSSKIDLSLSTSSGYSNWQMIVGDGTQLNDQNIRNIVNLTVTDSSDWLTPVVYIQNASGKRTNIPVYESNYNDYGDQDNRHFNITVPESKMGNETQAYVKLDVNKSAFSSTAYDHCKIYEGRFTDAGKAASGTDITAKLCGADMTQANAGYLLKRYSNKWVTMVAYDSKNQVIGCLPFYLYLNKEDDSNHIYVGWLFTRTNSGRQSVGDYRSYADANGQEGHTEVLYKGYAANAAYYLTMDYYQGGKYNSSAVTAAYAGKYSSIKEATDRKASDIKTALFSDNYNTAGYQADFSNGVDFTVFVGADGAANQEVYHYNVKTEEGDREKRETLSGGTGVSFSGLVDSSGAEIPAYIVNYDEDSYAEFNYLTILVGADADITNAAPVFTTSNGVKLYAAGSSSPEISGKSTHNFSNGAVQYTASAEDGVSSKNYWLQVVRATKGAGWLYVNSLADSNSNTTNAGGVIRSTREVMLDGYHEYQHDILLANMGAAELPSLSVELSSGVLELDKYWTLGGGQGLSGFSTTEKDAAAWHGEIPNLAKIRVKAKDGVTKGTDISGTLTIKSGGNTLMVLNLTGVIGDPCIVTDKIPQAVKYVPYGTMIQNNNKYSWNRTTYYLVEGSTLPKGMTVKPNGEIYGVPTEAGSFEFTVRMTNSASDFSDDEKTYVLTVLENTDANVDAATDTGYNLTERIQDIYLGKLPSESDKRLEALNKALEKLAEESQTMVSQGQYVEFIDIFLDGKKLSEGTDYTSNSGSTRITIAGETLAGGDIGTHTLGIEFRTGDDQTLKRAAQNYRILAEDDPNKKNSGGSGSSSGSSGGHGGEDSLNYATVVMRLVDASGQAMPGVTLELHSTPKVTKTDQNGIAVFYSVESGRHTIFVKDRNGNVLASKDFEVLFGDTTLLNGDQLIIKKGAASTLNMQLDGNTLVFLSLQEGDVYQVVPARTGDDKDSGLWLIRWLVFAGIGAGLYWWYDKRKKQFNN